MSKKGLTSTQLAEMIGKSRQSINNWLADGLPRNADKTFDLPACIAWMLQRERDNLLQDDAIAGAGDASPALERYRLARAESAELDLQVRRGSLFDKETVVREWAERMAVMRSALETWRDRLPPILIGQTREAMMKILDEAVQFLLTTYSKNTKNCPLVFIKELEDLPAWLAMTDDQRREIVQKLLSKMGASNG